MKLPLRSLLLSACTPGTCSSLSELQLNISRGHKGTDQAVSDAAVALEASAKAQQEALLQQISSMVHTFAADRAREVAAALQGMRQQLAADATAIGTETTAIQNAVVKSLGDLKVR